jgi:hypothetical protein
MHKKTFKIRFERGLSIAPTDLSLAVQSISDGKWLVCISRDFLLSLKIMTKALFLMIVKSMKT